MVQNKELVGASAESTLKQMARLVITNFFDHNVGRNGAALAYYLLFALFPLMIFVSNLLGLLNLDVANITRKVQDNLSVEVSENISG